MTRGRRTKVQAALARSNVTGDIVDGAPRFQSPEDRLSALAGILALRASGWGWARIYERWRAGKPVSAFHRKFLAVSSHYHAMSGERAYDHVTIRAIRPLPERSR